MMDTRVKTIEIEFDDDPKTKMRNMLRVDKNIFMGSNYASLVRTGDGYQLRVDMTAAVGEYIISGIGLQPARSSDAVLAQAIVKVAQGDPTGAVHVLQGAGLA